MATIRQLTINHNGLSLDIDVTYFVPGHSMPIASHADCPGFDDQGSDGEVEYNITGFEIDCSQTVIDAGCISLEDNEEITTKVFEEMSS